MFVFILRVGSLKKPHDWYVIFQLSQQTGLWSDARFAALCIFYRHNNETARWSFWLKLLVRNVGKRWRVESFQRPKADRSKQMEKPAMLPALFVCLSPFVLLICLFLVSIQSSSDWAQSAEKPRHNTAVSIDERGSMGQDPPLRRAAGGLLKQDARNGSRVPAARASDT